MYCSVRQSAFLIVYIIVGSLIAHTAHAQSHFDSCISRTAENAIVIIPAGINPTVAGAPIEAGDEIAVFTDDGTCAGVTVWSGESTSLAAWGADEYSAIGGYEAGDRLRFVVWDASEDAEYRSVRVTYSDRSALFQSDGLYGSNAIFELAGLHAINAPEPTTPANGATGQSGALRLEWTPVDHVESYHLEIAEGPAFENLIVSETGLSDTSFVASGLAQGMTYYWRVGATTGSEEPVYSNTYQFVIASTHAVALSEGWNLVSSYVRPTDDSLTSITAQFGDAVVVKDEQGNLFLPSRGIDEIGTWEAERGYKVHVGTQGTLTMVGSLLEPQSAPVVLQEGWNWVGYSLQSALSTNEALASIADDIVMAKDIDGLVHYPEFEIDELQTLEPGKGYAVYVQNAATLVYPTGDAGDPATATASLRQAEAAATTSGAAQTVRRGVASSAHLVVSGLDVEDGVELSVWSDGRAVGHGVVEDSTALLLVLGDEPNTPEVEGAVAGGALVIRAGTTYDAPAVTVGSATDVLSGRSLSRSLTYAEDTIVDIAAAVTTNTMPDEGPATLQLTQNYPNPFSGSTTIAYSLETNSHVQLDVFNLLGQRVQQLVDSVQPAGRHEVDVDGRTLASGTYVYRLATNGQVVTRSMVVAR